MTPTIHLNGTSAKELVELVENTIRALTTALDAMMKAAPNGRDYYVQGEDAFEVARDEHRERIGKLTDVLRDQEGIYLAIVEQAEERGIR